MQMEVQQAMFDTMVPRDGIFGAENESFSR